MFSEFRGVGLPLDTNQRLHLATTANKGNRGTVGTRHGMKSLQMEHSGNASWNRRRATVCGVHSADVGSSAHRFAKRTPERIQMLQSGYIPGYTEGNSP